jgi:hypothetical protein
VAAVAAAATATTSDAAAAAAASKAGEAAAATSSTWAPWREEGGHASFYCLTSNEPIVTINRCQILRKNKATLIYYYKKKLKKQLRHFSNLRPGDVAAPNFLPRDVF